MASLQMMMTQEKRGKELTLKKDLLTQTVQDLVWLVCCYSLPPP